MPIEMYLPTSDTEFRVFCDERHLKGFKRSEFKEALKARLLPQLPAKVLVQIEMVNSTTNANVQIADWIAGILGRYLEGREPGAEGFQILQNNFLRREGKELFRYYEE